MTLAFNHRGFSSIFLLLIIPLFFILLTVGTFVFVAQPNMVAGNSMYPLYPDRAYLIASKLSYRLAKPQRGDVIIFHSPKNPDQDYISRIIGLPGEVLDIKEEQIFINSKKLDEPYLKNISTLSSQTNFSIPLDNYFLLGDNRSHSSDSRNLGFVPRSFIVGKVIVCFANCQPRLLPVETPTPVTQGSTPQIPSEGQPEIRDDKVYIHNKELFINTIGVKSVRFGPERKTIHFRLSDATSYQARCADFTKKIEALPSDYTDPPPIKEPWDYKRVGYAYTIAGCNGGGFLKRSPYFVYLKIDKNRNGVIVLENLDTQQVSNIPVEGKYLNGFFDSQPNKAASFRYNVLFAPDEKFVYLFPQDDAPEINGRLLVSFANLIMGIDIKTKEITGTIPLIEPDYRIVATAYGLITNETIPVAVVNSGWEGATQYQILVDYSGEKLLTVKLNEDIDHGGFDLLKTRKVQWRDSLVLITTYTENDIPQENYQEIYSQIKDFGNSIETDRAEQLAEASLSQKFPQYFAIKCIFSPGIIGGCYGGSNITTYKYVIGSGQLIKL